MREHQTPISHLCTNAQESRRPDVVQYVLACKEIGDAHNITEYDKPLAWDGRDMLPADLKDLDMRKRADIFTTRQFAVSQLPSLPEDGYYGD